jgi:hypothetical protein
MTRQGISVVKESFSLCNPQSASVRQVQAASSLLVNRKVFHTLFCVRKPLWDLPIVFIENVHQYGPIFLDNHFLEVGDFTSLKHNTLVILNVAATSFANLIVASELGGQHIRVYDDSIYLYAFHSLMD